jgi:Fur family ferric uptake transcriptional regulator
MQNKKSDHSELKKAGLKATLPRQKILHILENKKTRHMRAEEVYAALLDSGEDVGLATVYRVLTQFEAAGIVIRHRFESGHAVFELDDGMHHDHLVCIGCGQVEEFLDPIIEAQQLKVAKEFGFTLTDHSLCLYGKCRKCGG